MAQVDSYLQELEQEAHATRRVLERIPPDRLECKPHAKSLSFGQLGLHVATLPAAIAELASHESFDVRTEIPRPSASRVSDIIDALEVSLQKAQTLLSAMDDASLAAPWRMLSGDQEVARLPRAALLRSVLLNHWIHHRGQLTVYLRLCDVPVPAIYGASADEHP